jgi:outer membrane protein
MLSSFTMVTLMKNSTMPILLNLGLLLLFSLFSTYALSQDSRLVKGIGLDDNDKSSQAKQLDNIKKQPQKVMSEGVAEKVRDGTKISFDKREQREKETRSHLEHHPSSLIEDINGGSHIKNEWILDTSPRKNRINISESFKLAYLTNPQLSAQRANTRGIDESLQIAFGSFMPKVYGQATALTQSFNLMTPKYDQSAFGGRDGLDLKTNPTPVFAGLTASLNVFNGFKGVNGVNQAEAQIHQSRELLRTSELSVFLATVQSYMSVLNDAAVYKIRKKYTDVVAQQLVVGREKVKGGEISETDLREIESYLAQGERNAVAANTALQGSIAFFKRVTGIAPNTLTPAKAIEDKLPKTQEAALVKAFRDHPLIVAARYNVDINKYAVKIAEAGLLPTVDLVAGYGQNWNYFGTQGQRLYQGGGGVQINVPFYDGGVSYGSIRQAKQRLGEAESLYDFQITQIRQQVETNWAAWHNSSRLLLAARQQVARAEEALAGLRYEIDFGLRTTWDVLNYQQILTEARVAMVNAQRERVISSYTVLASIGDLDAQNLNLDIPRYDPSEHYNRVKLQMIGTDPW